jgi:precorrin-2/cobalt-factor-2 C20-methyltransferase
MTSEAVSQQHIGTLYGIGVGPGAPDLLTLRAERILKQCPVICLPASTGRRSYAGTIIETHIDRSWQEIVAVKFPMRNVWEQALPARNEAVMTLLSYLQSGRDVAFVTEGDPLLYSTFGYMLDAVRQSNPEIHIEVIPGITSITAAAAAAQLPLTSWDERLAVLPAFHVLEQNAERGTDTESPLRSIFQLFDTVVLLKVNKIFDPLLDLLEELDLVQSAVFVRRCSTDQEEVIFDIQCLRGQTLDYFSLLIVRKSHAIYHR